jgi:hypothetical protein
MATLALHTRPPAHRRRTGGLFPARVLRARRRMIVGTFLLTLWIVLVLTGYNDVPQNVELSSFGGWALFVTACFILAVPIVCVTVFLLALLEPGLLPAVEVALAASAATMFVSLARMAAGLPWWIDFIVLFAAWWTLSQILAGLWLSHLGRRDTPVRRTVFVVAEPADKVWSRIVPLPENAGTYYWPKAMFLAPPDGSDADFVLLSPRRGHLPQLLEANWIEAREADRSVTLRSAPLPGSSTASERRTYRLEPVGTGTRVEIEVGFLDVPLGRRVALWISNDPGNYLDSLRDQASGRPDRSVFGREMLPA